MRFSLRTLLIALLLAGPLSLLGWNQWQAYQRRIAEEQARNAWVSQMQPLILTGPTQANGKTPSPAEREIWDQQRDKISWESFPESTPPAP